MQHRVYTICLIWQMSPFGGRSHHLEADLTIWRQISPFGGRSHEPPCLDDHQKRGGDGDGCVTFFWIFLNLRIFAHLWGDRVFMYVRTHTCSFPTAINPTLAQILNPNGYISNLGPAVDKKKAGKMNKLTTLNCFQTKHNNTI